MANRRIKFRNCKESRTLLHALYSRESKFCYVKPLLRALHWLPVANRIVFKNSFYFVFALVNMHSFCAKNQWTETGKIRCLHSFGQRKRQERELV